MKVGEALEKLGMSGKWEIIHYITIGIACSCVASFHMFAIVFIGKFNTCFSLLEPKRGPRPRGQLRFRGQKIVDLASKKSDLGLGLNLGFAALASRLQLLVINVQQLSTRDST